jgi:hypothetical protein
VPTARQHASRTRRGSSSRLVAAIPSADPRLERGSDDDPFAVREGVNSEPDRQFSAPTSSVWRTADRAGGGKDGKVVEKRGGNGAQTVRAFQASKPLQQAKSLATGCGRLPPKSHGKEGVDGSSPSEGSTKDPHHEAFCVGSICRFANVGQVWGPLWRLQVETPRATASPAAEHYRRPPTARRGGIVSGALEARFAGSFRTGSAFTDANRAVGSDRAGRRARDNRRRPHSLAPEFDLRSL